VDKIPAETESIESFLGRRVHEILERLYHHVARYGRPPSLYKVHERFQRDWESAWHERVTIARSASEPADYHAIGLRCLTNYYRAHYPFNEGETVGIEHPLALSLDAEGRYRIRGVIDRLVRRDAGHYEIHDYKTGGSLPPRPRLERDRQLALYQIGIHQTYPDAERVELVWHYVQFGKTMRSERSREQLETLRGETIEQIERIESAIEYPARPGPLCRWCEYRSLCPEGGALEERRPDPSPPPLLAGLERTPSHGSGRPVQLSLF
jgi:putative RecB family exonuclease